MVSRHLLCEARVVAGARCAHGRVGQPAVCVP